MDEEFQQAWQAEFDSYQKSVDEILTAAKKHGSPVARSEALQEAQIHVMALSTQRICFYLNGIYNTINSQPDDELHG